MKLIVTHRSPDIDAITSVWMLKRFDPEHFADAKVAFVDAGSTISSDTTAELGFSSEEVVHTDTGLGEFDHHQADRAKTRVCATSLVYDHVCAVNPSHKQNWPLQQIVEFTLVDDHFEDFFYPEITEPRYLFSLRGILHGAEVQGLHTDETQLAFGFKCLDAVYAALIERKKAIDEVEKGAPFESPWGKALALQTGNRAVVRYAQMLGYEVVVQKDPKRGGVDIKAAPKDHIDLTPVYEKIKQHDKSGDWFFHGGKHMIINNSSHSNQKPTKLTLEEVVALIKEAK